jgi:predicted transcriptional regulator
MEVATMSVNEWALTISKVLSQGAKASCDVIPKGFKTHPEIAKESGRSLTRCYVYLERGVKMGLIEKRKLKTKSGNTIKHIAFYKIIKKK